MKAKPADDKKICTACGSTANRAAAQFCLDCGKNLGETYQPLDAVRSSYRLQHMRVSGADAASRTEILFENSGISAADTAWACIVYSMVPYLGVLFTPLAIMLSGTGMLTAVARGPAASRRTQLIYLSIAVAVALVQIALWLALYIVPKMQYVQF